MLQKKSVWQVTTIIQPALCHLGTSHFLKVLYNKTPMGQIRWPIFLFFIYVLVLTEKTSTFPKSNMFWILVFSCPSGSNNTCDNDDYINSLRCGGAVYQAEQVLTKDGPCHLLCLACSKCWWSSLWLRWSSYRWWWWWRWSVFRNLLFFCFYKSCFISQSTTQRFKLLWGPTTTRGGWVEIEVIEQH